MSQLSITNLSSGTQSNEIILPANTYLQSSSFSAYRGPGSIIQRKYYYEMTTADKSTTSTSSVTAIYASINPTRASSKILVRFHSSMAGGSGNNRYVFQMELYRRINAGNWLLVTPRAEAASRYQYGWSYVNRSWARLTVPYLDSPESDGTVEYAINWRSRTSGQTTVICYRYMEMGVELTEIGQ